jgi:hypothetical protein
MEAEVVAAGQGEPEKIDKSVAADAADLVGEKKKARRRKKKGNASNTSSSGLNAKMYIGT